MVKTQCFHCHGPGSIPCEGTKTLQAKWCSQKKKKKKNPGSAKIIYKNRVRNTCHQKAFKFFHHLLQQSLPFSGRFCLILTKYLNVHYPQALCQALGTIKLLYFPLLNFIIKLNTQLYLKHKCLTVKYMIKAMQIIQS